MNTVYLAGAEGVRRAGSQIESAAADMERAARNFEGAVDRLICALDQHATRIEQAQRDLAAIEQLRESA